MEESGSLYCQEEGPQYNINGNHADFADHLINGNDSQTGSVCISGTTEEEPRRIFSAGETDGC